MYSPRTRRLIEEAQGASLEADKKLDDDADEAAAAAEEEEEEEQATTDDDGEEEYLDMSVYSPRTRSLIEGAQQAAGEASQQRSDLLDEATEAAASSAAAASSGRATKLLVALLAMLCASALYLFAKVRSNTGVVTKEAGRPDPPLKVGAKVTLDGDTGTVTGLDDDTNEVEITYDDGNVERISQADARRIGFAEDNEPAPETQSPEAATTNMNMNMMNMNNSEIDNFLMQQQRTGLGRSAAAVDDDVVTSSTPTTDMTDEEVMAAGFATEANVNDANAGLKQELAALKQGRETKEGAAAAADDRRIAEIEAELMERDMGGDIGAEDVEDTVFRGGDITASGQAQAQAQAQDGGETPQAGEDNVIRGDITASGQAQAQDIDRGDDADGAVTSMANPEKLKVGDRVALQVCGMGGGRGRRSCKAVKSVCAAQWKSMVQESAQHAGQAAQLFSKAGGAGSRALAAFMGGTAAKIYGLASGAPIPMPDYKGKGQVDAMTEKLSKTARNPGLSESQRQNAAQALMACGSLWHHQARMVAESMAIQYHEFLHTKMERGKKWSDNPEFYYREFTTSYYKDPLAADKKGRGQREAYAKTYPTGQAVLRPGAEHDALGMMAMKPPAGDGDPAAAALQGTVEELDMESIEGSCTAKIVTDGGATMAWPCFDLKRVSAASVSAASNPPPPPGPVTNA